MPHADLFSALHNYEVARLGEVIATFFGATLVFIVAYLLIAVIAARIRAGRKPLREGLRAVVNSLLFRISVALFVIAQVAIGIGAIQYQTPRERFVFVPINDDTFGTLAIFTDIPHSVYQNETSLVHVYARAYYFTDSARLRNLVGKLTSESAGELHRIDAPPDPEPASADFDAARSADLFYEYSPKTLGKRVIQEHFTLNVVPSSAPGRRCVSRGHVRNGVRCIVNSAPSPSHYEVSEIVDVSTHVPLANLFLDARFWEVALLLVPTILTILGLPLPSSSETLSPEGRAVPKYGRAAGSKAETAEGHFGAGAPEQ